MDRERKREDREVIALSFKNSDFFSVLKKTILKS